MARGDEERGIKAMKAMKDLGISPKKSKPVLKKLLKVSGNSWEYIETDNYSALVDAILDAQETDNDKKKEVLEGEQSSQQRKKKQKVVQEDDIPPASVERPASDAEDATPLRFRRRRTESASMDMVPFEPSAGVENSGPVTAFITDLTQPQDYMNEDPSHMRSTERHTTQVGTSPEEESDGQLVLRPCKKVVQAEALNATEEVNSQKACSSDSILVAKRKDKVPSPAQTFQGEMPPIGNISGLICYNEPNIGPVGGPKKQNKESLSIMPLRPKDEPVDFEIPISVMKPAPAVLIGGQGNDSLGSSSFRQIEGPSGRQDVERTTAVEGNLPAVTDKKNHGSELANIHNPCSKSFEIASSTTGEVKISLSCSSDDFQMPSLETLCKLVEDRCLKSYKILQPFNLLSVMTEMCQCALELGSKNTEREEVNSLNFSPVVEGFLKSSGPIATSGGIEGLSSQNFPNQSKSHQLQLVSTRLPHNVDDITKGEESIKISIVNEINRESVPTFFHYIPRNIIFQNGYVNISLARIGDENCCADCFGNCFAPIPCACARETGGEFAYTAEGLIKNDFLDACISMSCDSHKHKLIYCKECPLERSKNGGKAEPCRGHLIRKFVKECWSKCGCNKQCGNRVVQRGITRNLQVFYTKEGKGWGLRTLEELPKGAFVCEYVGEILTNMELYERTIRTTGKARHTYPVLLDADWGSERILKDEEALCLDATFYGNVGRFVNHRCADATLIEVPVEVESPDHHYYHHAFFTTRKIEAMEELTWDYGIDFTDNHHPIKAFLCRCGSTHCRDSRKKPRIRSD